MCVAPWERRPPRPRQCMNGRNLSFPFPGPTPPADLPGAIRDPRTTRSALHLLVLPRSGLGTAACLGPVVPSALGPWAHSATPHPHVVLDRGFWELPRRSVSGPPPVFRSAPTSSYVPTGGSATEPVSTSPIRRFEVVDGSSHATPWSSIGSTCDRTVLDTSSDATPSTTARRSSPS